MDIVESRKCYNFRISTRQRRTNSRIIFNQTTIVGSILNLMKNQKVVLALVRIQDKGISEQTIPIGFKIQKNQIPNDVKPDRIHTNNLVNLEVFGGKPLPVMIICIGDDSLDISVLYKQFCAKVKEKKLPGLAFKIQHWLQTENIDMTRIPKSAFKPVSSKEFNSFLAHIDSLKPHKPSHVSDQRENKVTECVTLSDDNSTPSKSTTSTIDFSRSQSANDQGSCCEDINEIKYLMNSTNDLIAKYKASVLVLSPNKPVKLQFVEIAQIQQNILEILGGLLRSFTSKDKVKKESSCDVRIIHEEDQTTEDGNITLIEGLLPVRTNKYKAAISSLPINYHDREPSQVITTLARTCFPDHWVSGVTLKGSGGRKSLLDLWSWEDPLKDPVSGKVDKNLGFQRYQALIDHTMRKCGKKSYDHGTEKHLGSVLSKAIHYKRTKLGKSKGWDEFDDSGDDGEFDWPEESDSEEKSLQDDDDEKSEDEFLPPSKNRKARISKSSTDEKNYQTKRVTRNSGILQPKVSMTIGSPMSIHADDDEIINKDAGLRDIAHKKDANKPVEEDEKTIDAENSNDPGMPESDVQSKKLQDKIEKMEIGESGGILKVDLTVRDSEKAKLSSSSGDDFIFDDDDDLLKSINYLSGSPSSEVFSSDESTSSKNKSKKESNIAKNNTGKALEKINSSTPLAKEAVTAKFSVSPITKISEQISDDSIEREFHKNQSAESGIELSSNERSIESNSVEFPLISISPSTSCENKRKLSSASKDGVKKFKNIVSSNDEESNASISSEARSSASSNQSAPIKFMDPMTLAFINDPANAAFLKEIITKRSAQSPGKN